MRQIYLILFILIISFSAACADSVIVEQIPEDENCRYYHVRTRHVPEDKIAEIEKIDGVLNDEDYSYNSGPIAGQYRVIVWKGKAFSWDEIEPKILEILNR